MDLEFLVVLEKEKKMLGEEEHIRDGSVIRDRKMRLGFNPRIFSGFLIEKVGAEREGWTRGATTRASSPWLRKHFSPLF